jgi:heme oxygenase
MERLERDLRTLGLNDEAIEAVPTLGEDRLPTLRDRPAVLGCLYVVEGSQLGHRVLWKRLRAALDAPATQADAFLGVPPDRTRMRWEQFQEVLDQKMSTDDAVSAAVTTARATFRAYRGWLS